MRNTLLLLGAIALLCTPLAAQDLRPVHMVSDGLGTTYATAVAAGGNNMAWSAWVDKDAGGLNAIMCATSDNGGKTWGAPVRVDADASGASKYNLVMFEDGGTLHLGWHDERAGTSLTGVFYGRSTDGGLTFTEAQMDGGTGVPSTNDLREWNMTVSGDHVYFLISEDYGDEGLHCTASHDGGATWGAAVNVVSTGVATDDVDAIAIDAQQMDVYVAFVDDRAPGSSSADNVWFQMSHDGGATWMANEIQVDDPTTSGDAEWELAIGHEGSHVFVVWGEERASTSNEDLFINMSHDGGATWHTFDSQVGTAVAGAQDVDNPSVTGTGIGNIIVAWEDNRTGTDEAFVAMSSDGGMTFTAETQLSMGGGSYPMLTASGEVVVCGYGDTGYPETTGLGLSLDGGMNFVPMTVNPGMSGDADYVSVAIDHLYKNIVVGFSEDSGATNDFYAGGLRVGQLSVNGVLSAGSPVNFTMHGCPAPEEGNVFQVVASGSLGIIPFFDGRVIELTADSTFSMSRSYASFLTGHISGGSGSTTVIPWPGVSTFPVGMDIYFVAVNSPGGGFYGTITDPVMATVVP